MLRKGARWHLGAVNEQTECPLQDRAGQPVMADAEEER